MRAPATLLLLVATCNFGFADVSGSQSYMPEPVAIPLPSNVKVFFHPQQDIEAAIVTLIGQARTEILINQLALSSPRIADALVDAYNGSPSRAKIVIGLLLDESPPIRNYEGPAFLANNHIPFLYATSAGRNNHKYVVVDRRIVAVGSYDWTATAADNNEDLVVIDEPGVASAFAINWFAEAHRAKIPNSAKLTNPTP
jgi:phosphatidylserine/phosphatidylglycerophosphate/cardiolipin synthase-like enzyme